MEDSLKIEVLRFGKDVVFVETGKNRALKVSA